MKTLAEIEKGLAEVYSGPTFEKNGFTYIPWNEAAKVANRVFGIDGYNVETLKVEQLGQGYMAHVRVTVFPTDSNPFWRDGIGYNELTGDNGRAHDTAVKGAPSDALNRALKLFGEAFGLNLYDKAERGGAAAPARPNNQATDTRATSTQQSNNDKRPSEKQNGVLLKAGYPQAQIDKMDFATWKGCIDSIFGKGKAPVAPAKAAKTEPVEEINLSDDEIPF